MNAIGDISTWVAPSLYALFSCSQWQHLMGGLRGGLGPGPGCASSTLSAPPMAPARCLVQCPAACAVRTLFRYCPGAVLTAYRMAPHVSSASRLDQRTAACAVRTPLVIPAKAGIHGAVTNSNAKWIPAFAGMRGWPKVTKGEAVALLVYDTRLLDHPNPAKPSAISAKLAGSGSAASTTVIE